MSFTYDATGVSTQGELSSSYTNALSSYLQGDGADLVAFLAYAVNGLSVEDATALKADLASGNFSLSGLFSAAQSKEGAVDGDSITDPTPTLTVGDVIIDLSAMLTGTETFTWDTVTKKLVISHTREFYTESKDPDGYAADWADPQVNQEPTADAIVLNLTEYDEKAAAKSGPDLTDVNLITAANAADADGDTLSVVADSVTLVGGGDLPAYISYTNGVLSIDKNHSSLDDLYLGATWTVAIEYQITDGVNAPITNTVDLTITGTADQFTKSTNITSSVTTFNTTTWDGAINFTITDAPSGAFDFTGTAAVTVVGDIDGVTQQETVTVSLEGGDTATLGMTTTGNKEPGNPNYQSGGYTDTDVVDFASSDTSVSGNYNSNTLPGADGVDGLNLVQVAVTEYQYWL